MQFKCLVLVSFAVFLGVNVTGCGTTAPAGSTEIGNTNAVARIVTERAQQRWNALLKKDMEAAYQLISPAGRSLMSLDIYRPRVNPGFWRGAKVKEATCAAETCEVTVLVDMEVERVKFTNSIKETWILDAGKWWFVYRA